MHKGYYASQRRPVLAVLCGLIAVATAVSAYANRNTGPWEFWTSALLSVLMAMLCVDESRSFLAQRACPHCGHTRLAHGADGCAVCPCTTSRENI